MTDPLRVLLYGAMDAGISDSIRFGAMAAPLRRHGVDLVAWEQLAPYDLTVPSRFAADPTEAVGYGRAEIDLSPLDQADVLVFRRWYSTRFACGSCDHVARNREQLRQHVRRFRHAEGGQDLHARVLLDELRRRPELFDRIAVVYDTDDDLFHVPPEAGFSLRLAPELEDVSRILARADLVTATTPVLARTLADRTAAPVRVVRNALVPEWYADTGRNRDASQEIRIVYHGNVARLRDYARVRDAVDTVAAERPDVRRVWLGSDDSQIAAIVDRVHAWVPGVEAFERDLAALGPDIGLAPLLPDAYNAARSELHWLEYAFCKAPAVVAGLGDAGPYDVVRDGVDGCVAGTAREWLERLRALVQSRTLRDEIGGHAFERVSREYTVEARASDWAEAYRDAAARRRPTAAVSISGFEGRPPDVSGAAGGRDPESASSPRVRVLVYGAIDSAVTDMIRIGQFVPALRGLGVEVRAWTSFGDDLIRGDPLSALEWADVLLFRRWRSTHTICTACEGEYANETTLASHLAETGHRTIMPDRLLPGLLDLLRIHRELIDAAILYDTDDDVLGYPDWTGFGPAARRERDVITATLRLADVVTVSTPVLASRLAPHVRGRVRVLRNAIDPAWYRVEPVRASGPEESPVRVAYHGVAARVRDYAIARPAVNSLADEGIVRRIWIGASRDAVGDVADEIVPWVDGVEAFARTLAAARPEIGLAPLVDEPFNRAKSELHWLEYAACGAPAIVSGFRDGGPFDVVRDGIDGLVAYDARDWERHLSALVASPQVRADLAGRAQERLLAEYTLPRRATEWAETFSAAARDRRETRAAGSLKRPRD